MARVTRVRRRRGEHCRAHAGAGGRARPRRGLRKGNDGVAAAMAFLPGAEPMSAAGPPMREWRPRFWGQRSGVSRKRGGPSNRRRAAPRRELRPRFWGQRSGRIQRGRKRGGPTVKTLAPPAAQRGIALVLVLWLTILLTVIASAFAYSMHTEALTA